MPSTNKTPRYGLSQWVGGDKPSMLDFNADNRAIEAAVGSIADSVHAPIIRNGTWHVYSVDAGGYVDTGEQAGFTILGYYATLADLQAAATSPAAGDAYGIGPAAPYDIYVWDAGANAWVDNGPLQGQDAIVAIVAVTLPPDGWASNSQTVAAEGVTADSVIICSPAPSNLTIAGAYGIYAAELADGAITFNCNATPPMEITMHIGVMRG